MTEISVDNAIARTRSQLGLGPLIPARAWRVQRIDRPGATYYLIVFGDDKAAVAVAAVNAVSAEVLTSAMLPGRGPHVTVDTDHTLQKAGLTGAQAELVWRPCRVSLSPLYPFWQVRSGAETVYVDLQGVVWKTLESAGPGG